MPQTPKRSLPTDSAPGVAQGQCSLCFAHSQNHGWITAILGIRNKPQRFYRRMPGLAPLGDWLLSCEMSLEHFSLRSLWADLEHLASFGQSALEAKECCLGETLSLGAGPGQDGSAGHLPGMQTHPSQGHRPLDLCQRYLHGWGRDVVPG